MDNQDDHHNWTKINIGVECENLDKIYFSEISTSMCFGLSSSKPTSFCVDFESRMVWKKKIHVYHEFKNRIWIATTAGKIKNGRHLEKYILYVIYNYRGQWYRFIWTSIDNNACNFTIYEVCVLKSQFYKL